MTYLTLLSYGCAAEYRRAIGTILSFYAHYHEPARVATVLFTDNPEFFRPYLAGLPVDYVLLTDERRRAMYGPHNYAFRVKIGILAELMQRQPGADVLYLDSDTFFLDNPASLLRELAAGVAFMHQPEYTFAEAVIQYAARPDAAAPRRLVELLERQIFLVNGQLRHFTATQKGWNSGVLGLPAAAAALLPDVFALTDAFYAGSGWFTSEQLAFSLALPVRFPLRRADAYVCHYWSPGQKTHMDACLTPLITPALASQPLAIRLAAVAARTSGWHRQLALEKLHEGALYAASRGRLVPALKYALKALARAPFDLAFMRRLTQVLRAQPAP
ncbi:hypothetical protein [Hymenobacter canadensis]|uniref:Nucleotide-diphospho-sugar transferase domain-containing protein n=1 Tax=Hymenobacter canadensis TaxID=2999067 RepID=A0ABY7LRN7_9BACT|nr:hypothetical protein [Hymenobacter canadensis]WBA43083.1 hypothetical protein O3303_05825 [Hymenobacter canadensis]